MSFTDPIGLPVTVVQGAADVEDRPETSTITSVQFSPQSFYIRHTKEASWPQPIPPGWEGGVQYTHWVVLWVDGKWLAVPTIECWKTAADDPFSGTWKGGDPSPFSNGKKDWWYYAPEVAQKQPHNGELIGVFVTAGSQRQKDVTDPSCIERSNLVWVNVPSADTGLYTFGDTPQPAPGPGPTPPPSGLPPYDDALAVEFGQGINTAYAEPGAPSFDAGMVSVYSERAAFDYYRGVLDWPTARDKHLNAFRESIGVPPLS